MTERKKEKSRFVKHEGGLGRKYDEEAKGDGKGGCKWGVKVREVEG